MFSEDANVREIQEESLHALMYFHELCVSNDIHYSIHAGTMLGAVREKGFIQWDDDVDISMTREEYNKFESLLKTIQLEKWFSFDKKTYETPHVCLHRPGKPLVWLSIFVYDYISEIKAIQKLKTYIIATYYILMSRKDKNKKNNNKGIKKAIVCAIQIMGTHMDREKMLTSYQYFCEHCLVGDKKYIQRSNDRYCDIGVKKIIPYKWMSEYQEILFEGKIVEVSSYYNNILESSYGEDYMIPKKDNSKEEMHQFLRETLIRGED